MLKVRVFILNIIFTNTFEIKIWSVSDWEPRTDRHPVAQDANADGLREVTLSRLISTITIV